MNIYVSVQSRYIAACSARWSHHCSGEKEGWGKPEDPESDLNGAGSSVRTGRQGSEERSSIVFIDRYVASLVWKKSRELNQS